MAEVAREALQINEAARSTGWSARMLRYIERLGLIAPPRSAGGYRLYRAQELAQLRALRELIGRFDLELAEVGFALRLRGDRRLREALEALLSAQPRPPAELGGSSWLDYEQRRHEQLLQQLGRPPAGKRRAATVIARQTTSTGIKSTIEREQA
jgi:MerR family copper efflux transcriptional regulator